MTSNKHIGSSPSILLIGATSLASHEIVNQLVDHSSQPTVHIFCDRSTDFHDKHQKSCASICYGDSSRATDILEALRETEANIIILCIDSRDDAKSKILTDSAWAVCSAMKMPGFYHINAIVLSSFGAGTSRIKIRRLLGYGRLLSRGRRKNSLKDCTGQESAFLVNGLDNRTVIIRTTDLTDGKPTGNIVEFGDEERAPSYRVDCVDVANYVAREIFNGMTGRIVNITGR